MASVRLNKNNSLILQDKCKLIEQHENGQKSIHDLVKSWKVSKATVYNILNNKAKIQAEAAKRGFGKRKRIKPPKFEAIEKALYRDFVDAKKSNPKLPITGPWLKLKAQAIAEKLNITDFKGSDAWLDGFKTRYQLTTKKACGEESKVNEQELEVWIEENKETFLNYLPKDIFNADETGLFYRMLPSQTVHHVGEACHGGKLSKERITVLLCANWDGSEKLTPLVIGKSANPRYFPKKPKSQRYHLASKIGCEYRQQACAWMNSNIFGEWLLSLQKKCKSENRKILLLLDNFSCHNLDLDLPNIEIVFFPPNTTSKSQPLDQGIINNTKQFYKRKLVNFYWSQAQVNGKDSLKEINLLQGIRLLKDAWDEVKSQTIQNCFRHALPSIHDQLFDFVDDFILLDQPPVNAEMIKNLFPSGVTFSDFVNCDNNLITLCENDSDEDKDENQQIDSEPNGTGESDLQTQSNGAKVTDKQAIEALVTLINHCNQSNIGSPEASTAFNKYLEQVVGECINNRKQTDIRSYFSSNM